MRFSRFQYSHDLSLQINIHQVLLKNLKYFCIVRNMISYYRKIPFFEKCDMGLVLMEHLTNIRLSISQCKLSVIPSCLKSVCVATADLFGSFATF